MSEEILKVFLDDLATIRVACQKCGVVIELNMQAIATTLTLNKCPQCQQDFSPPGAPQGYRPLHELADVFKYLDSVKSRVKIEFPVKIK